MIQRITYSIFVVTILLINSLQSQERKEVGLQELEGLLQSATTDSLRIEALYNLGAYLIQKGNTTSIRYLEDGLQLIDKTSLNDYYQHKKAEYHSRIGSVYRIRGDYKKSIENFMLAEKIGIELKDSILISDMIHNIGVAYRAQRKYDKALIHLKKALEIKKRLDEDLGIAITYGELGVNYRRIKKLDSALVCYEKAKEIYTRLKNEEKLFSIKGNMSVLYSAKGDQDQAVRLAKECIAYHTKEKNKESLCNAYSNVASFYRKKKEYETSLFYYNLAQKIAKEEGYKHRLMNIYKSKGIVYDRLGNYKEAYSLSKQYKRISDAIFNNENEKRIAEMEYEFNLYKQQLAFDNEKTKLDLSTKAERKEKILYFVLFLIAVFSGVLITRLIRKNTKQRIEIAIANLEKEQIEKQHLNKELKSKTGDIKKIVADNRIRQELQKQVLDEVKHIIRLEDEKERTLALKSLNASLLSQVAKYESSLQVQEYLNDVDANFKILLETNFTSLNDKERNLLCLMKLGLKANDISILQNTTLASLKSTRYRIRKKLDIDSGVDIIGFIENQT